MMDRIGQISKVYIKSSKRKVEYATIDYVLESLYLMRARDNLPVFELLDVLVNGRIDSVSFSRNSPHCYFYARIRKEFISIIIRQLDEGKDIEFQVPLETLRLAVEDSRKGRL